MDSKRDSFEDVKTANTAATASAVSSAQAAGIPYFEADDLFVYAIYPDGRRVVVEKIRPLTIHPGDRAA